MLNRVIEKVTEKLPCSIEPGMFVTSNRKNRNTCRSSGTDNRVKRLFFYIFFFFCNTVLRLLWNPVNSGVPKRVRGQDGNLMGVTTKGVARGSDRDPINFYGVVRLSSLVTPKMFVEFNGKKKSKNRTYFEIILV